MVRPQRRDAEQVVRQDRGPHEHLEAVHPGVTVDQVRANTPIELLVADRVETTAPPSAHELDVLRALDPARQFIG